MTKCWYRFNGLIDASRCQSQSLSTIIDAFDEIKSNDIGFNVDDYVNVDETPWLAVGPRLSGAPSGRIAAHRGGNKPTVHSHTHTLTHSHTQRHTQREGGLPSTSPRRSQMSKISLSLRRWTTPSRWLVNKLSMNPLMIINNKKKNNKKRGQHWPRYSINGHQRDDHLHWPGQILQQLWKFEVVDDHRHSSGFLKILGHVRRRNGGGWRARLFFFLVLAFLVFSWNTVRCVGLEKGQGGGEREREGGLRSIPSTARV